MIAIDEKIKSNFKKVISYSQGIEDPNVDGIFNRWAENKDTFYTRWFGEKLIVDCGPVSFPLGEQAKHDRFYNFLDKIARFEPTTNELYDFVRAQGAEVFFKNHLKENYETPAKTILAGTKIIKAFKYFVPQGPLLTSLQDAASELIQENKVSGNLCFSIHPLDYLSLSENAHNWRSCHALDGEYRAGNISYMCDNTTIICYLRDNKEYKLPHFPDDVLWNSKKWRCLIQSKYAGKRLYYSFFGRQYPFTTEGSYAVVRENLLTKIANYYTIDSYTAVMNDCVHSFACSDGTEYYYPKGDNLVFPNMIINKQTLIQKVPGSKHYDDLLHSSCYIPHYIVHKHYSLDPRHPLQIGAPVYCVKCGQYEVVDAENLLCENCLDELNQDTCQVVCDNCGTHYNDEDSLWVNGLRLCPNCVENYTFECPVCGYIYMTHSQRYDEQNNRFVCSHCLGEAQPTIEEEVYDDGPWF